MSWLRKSFFKGLKKEGGNMGFNYTPVRTDFFPITSVCRADFEDVGFNAEALDDATMKQIAERMAEVYIENSFWIDLKYFAEEFNLPKLKHELKVSFDWIKSKGDSLVDGEAECSCGNWHYPFAEETGTKIREAFKQHEEAERGRV